MRSVRETITNGITTLPQLQESLQTAMQLEFSTIPPYLCAQWSIIKGQDPSEVEEMVKGVVVQEMLHFAFACNMLSAIGGTPVIASPGFVPTYPVSGLPGNVQPGLIVDLLPLGLQSLNTFMEIEYPETGAVVNDPDSIGAFYDTIAAGFTTVNPSFPAGTFQAPSTTVGQDHLTVITSVAEAVSAISLIKDQGEGTSSSPEEGTLDPNEFAHYYTYAQIYYGAELVQVNGQYQFSGTSITLPQVYPFAPSTGQPTSMETAFAQSFSNVMYALQQIWTSSDGNLERAIGMMGGLKTAGVACIMQKLTPPFIYSAPSVS
jgi:hypothetical protein